MHVAPLQHGAFWHQFTKFWNREINSFKQFFLCFRGNIDKSMKTEEEICVNSLKNIFIFYVILWMILFFVQTIHHVPFYDNPTSTVYYIVFQHGTFPHTKQCCAVWYFQPNVQQEYDDMSKETSTLWRNMGFFCERLKRFKVYQSLPIQL